MTERRFCPFHQEPVPVAPGCLHRPARLWVCAAHQDDPAAVIIGLRQTAAHWRERAEQAEARLARLAAPDAATLERLARAAYEAWHGWFQQRDGTTDPPCPWERYRPGDPVREAELAAVAAVLRSAGSWSTSGRNRMSPVTDAELETLAGWHAPGERRVMSATGAEGFAAFDGLVTFCRGCRQAWPCETRRLVEEVRRLRAALQQIVWLADATEPESVQAARIARTALQTAESSAYRDEDPSC